MPKTPGEMIEAVMRNLPNNTGKSADEWTAILKKSGPKEQKAQYTWLRTKHGLGHVAAKVLTGEMKAYDTPDKLVDAQYAGELAKLRTVHDAVMKTARKLGKDVAAKPCKTYVPLHRSKTFAIIKPERTRVDLGLCLAASTKAQGRLEIAKHLGSDRVTHKISLATPKDVNAEVAQWLAAAYELG